LYRKLICQAFRLGDSEDCRGELKIAVVMKVWSVRDIVCGKVPDRTWIRRVKD